MSARDEINETKAGKQMNRRIAVSALLGAVLTLGPTAAFADPVPDQPGTPPASLAPSQIYAGVGADAFAELTNNVASSYDASLPSGSNVLASYDAVNPVTAAAGETITTKPGCTLVRPNGANAGLKVLDSKVSSVDSSSPCVDFVRSSRPRDPAKAVEAGFTFYAQSRDAIGYATLGNAYAPTAALSSVQLKDIFLCNVSDWSEVGGQPGEIQIYLPPSSAATLTFFLAAIGTDYASVSTSCQGAGGAGTWIPRVHQAQQNDGRSLDGDPRGISPYAITKWAAQHNQAPGINDNRGGTTLGLVNQAVAPTTTTTLNGVSYEVLNPQFATGPSAAFGRYFYNVVRNGAPQELKDVFKEGGFLCQHQDALLVPFGNSPLGTDTTASAYCGSTVL